MESLDLGAVVLDRANPVAVCELAAEPAVDEKQRGREKREREAPTLRACRRIVPSQPHVDDGHDRDGQVPDHVRPCDPQVAHLSMVKKSRKPGSAAISAVTTPATRSQYDACAQKTFFVLQKARSVANAPIRKAIGNVTRMWWRGFPAIAAVLWTPWR